MFFDWLVAAAIVVAVVLVPVAYAWRRGQRALAAGLAAGSALSAAVLAA